MHLTEPKPNLEREEQKRLERKKNNKYCLSVFNSLFEFAMNIQHLRQQTGNAIPRSSIYDLRNNFVMGLEPVFSDQRAILGELITKVMSLFFYEDIPIADIMLRLGY